MRVAYTPPTVPGMQSTWEEPNPPHAKWHRSAAGAVPAWLVGGLALFGICTLLSLAAFATAVIIGAVSPPAIAATLDALPTPSGGAPTVGGNCECSSSSGAVCCCCQSCGCGAQAPVQAQPPATATGGNWDIDVGAPGVAGGGFCQCNGVCCCCSSCDCTGPGVGITNSTVHLEGNCNGVANCNGDLPARFRRRLDDNARQRLAASLVVPL